jgi:hypothetical protein
MRNGLKILCLVSGGLLAILAGVYFSVECYWPFAPYIDTRFSEKFSIDKFEAVQTGMSIEEVRKALGEPIWKQGCGGCWEQEYYVQDHIFVFPANRTCEASCNVDNQRWQFSDDGACSWRDFAWKYYAIDFSHGKVVAKYSSWHWD